MRRSTVPWVVLILLIIAGGCHPIPKADKDIKETRKFLNTVRADAEEPSNWTTLNSLKGKL